MIDSIDLYNLRNGEYSQFIQDVLKFTDDAGPAPLLVTAQFTALQAAGAQIESLFKVPTSSAITAELENFDLLRDNALKGLTAIIRGYTYSDDEVLQKHAAVLETHLALFGSNITTDSYQSETSSIRNIITDWHAQPQLTAAIEALNLQPWRTSLYNANNSFGENYLLRAAELGTDNAESLKTKRLEANELYYKLRDKINAYYTINDGAEPYKTLVANINGLIAFYNDTMSRRGSNGSEEVPAAPTPVPVP